MSMETMSVETITDRVNNNFTNFRGITLIEGDIKEFNGLVFKHIDFSYSNFNGVIFKNCKFTHCFGNYSNFAKNTFDNCVIENCNFSKSNFRSSSIICTVIKNSNFRYADFVGSLFDHCKLEPESVFSDCNMLGVQIDKSNIANCSFDSTNLSKAHIGSETRLCDSRFHYSNLRGVVMANIEINTCNFKNSNLAHAEFFLTKVENSDFSNINSTSLFVGKSKFFKCNFSEANLSYANLQGALSLEFCDVDSKDFPMFEHCGMIETNFSNAKIPTDKIFKECYFGHKSLGIRTACPEEGAFIAWKKAELHPKSSKLKCFSQFSLPCLVKLLIPEDALRSSSTTFKCRASKAKVLDVEILEDSPNFKALTEPPNIDDYVIRSTYDRSYTYNIGDILEVDNFDHNRWHECAPGIHFFLDKENARNY